MARADLTLTKTAASVEGSRLHFRYHVKIGHVNGRNTIRAVRVRVLAASAPRIHPRDALNGNVAGSVAAIATLRSRYRPRLMTFAEVYGADGCDDKSTR